MKKIKIITSQKISQQILRSSLMEAFDILPYLQNLQEQSTENFEELIKIVKSTVSFMHGKEHQLFRKILAKPMSRNSMLTFQEEIEKSVSEVLETLGNLTNLDLVQDFTDPLFIKLLNNVFGLEIEDEVKFIKNVSIATSITEPLLSIRNLRQLQSSLLELRDIVKQQLLKGTGKGLFKELNQNGTDIISDEQITTLLMTLVVASRTTTESLVCMLCKINDLELDMKVEMLSKKWLDENVDHLIRFCASTQYLTRVAKESITFGDLELKKGEQVIIDVPQSNRDKSYYGDDVVFDSNPSSKYSHISFGGGSHICPGFHFAKIVITIAVSEFFKTIPSFTYSSNQMTYESSTFAKRARTCPITVVPSE